MSVGIITGSGTYALPEFEDAQAIVVQTPFGEAPVTRGTFAGTAVLHVSRHGAGHAILSSGVNHRANIWALNELGASAVIGCTACGAVDPTIELGSLIVFDDLHFPVNRLPDGSICTFFTEPGDPRRGHWILHGGPFSPGIRAALLGAAELAGASGPRRRHLRARRRAAVQHPGRDRAARGLRRDRGQPDRRARRPCSAASSSCRSALIGFATDYANEVEPGEPTPVATLIELMGRSTEIFADVLRAALPALAANPPAPAGTFYRFEPG